MRLLLNESQIDRMIGNRAVYLIAGGTLLALLVLAPRGWGFGLSGFLFLTLGVFAGRLTRWRTEPGLWMLALFLGVVYGTGLGLLVVEWLNKGPHKTATPRAGREWEALGFTIDAWLAWGVLGLIAWFTASVALANWRSTRLKAPPGDVKPSAYSR